MSHLVKVRALARSVGVGRCLLTIRQFLGAVPIRTKLILATGLPRWWECRGHLNSIKQLTPMHCKMPGLEVHMLLNHPRLFEGMWAYASLARFVPGSCHLVVHDDGSLCDRDVEILTSTFQGCTVVRRPVADAQMNEWLGHNHLALCKKLRDSHVLGIKFFDVAVMAVSRHVLLLDSDVLFFHPPDEIINELAKPCNERRTLYLRDIDDCYCVSSGELVGILGRACLPAFNSGLAFVAAKSVDLFRVEEHLKQKGFWERNGKVHFWAEQTLWAMEMAFEDAEALPRQYCIAPVDRGLNGETSCHYCGGILQRHLFQTDGIPLVWADFVRGGLLSIESRKFGY